MVSVSSDFAPPLKLISPFFAVGSALYIVAIFSLFTHSSTFDLNSLEWIGTLHLYLLGYVMMIIVGALAQLLPVVLEKGHCCVGFYPIIFSLLFAGVVIMVVGFWFLPSLISYGGVLVVSAFSIFTVELFLTAKQEVFRSMSTKAMGTAAIFLVIGTLEGWIISASWNDLFAIDQNAFLATHIISVLGGGVLLVIFGIAQILLPMFGLAHGFNNYFASYAYKTLLIGIGLLIVCAFWARGLINVALGIVILAISIHLIQIIIILNKRARKELDVWYRSVVSGYIFLLASISVVVVGIVFGEIEWRLVEWFFGVGFLGFLINAHLYKIIPFLVWFERYSPLVGKQKVPMLHQMLPKRGADMQWLFSLAGTVLGAVGMMTHSDVLWHGGVSFMAVGAIFLLSNVMWMLKFK